MTNVYAVKKINTTNIKTPEEYQTAINAASIHYCNGFNELRAYCGGMLHRCGAGYAGTNGNIEFVVYKMT